MLALTCSSLALGEGVRERQLRQLLSQRSGVIFLPGGEFVLDREIVLPEGWHDVAIRGAGEQKTRLRASARFRGRAIVVAEKGRNLTLAQLSLFGHRDRQEKTAELPPADRTFAETYDNNGLLAVGVEGLVVEDVSLTGIVHYPLLISRCRRVAVRRVRIENSGSKNARGKNNASGGILLEDGTEEFDVADCRLREVRGNGVWTHARQAAPRNARGMIRGNEFVRVGRDAIQIGHAREVTVEHNTGREIGFPAELVDLDQLAVPVALDTAGNVERSAYRFNRFEEINGKCVDLDGFHHGEVVQNSCINRGSWESYPHGHFGIVLNNSNPGMQSRAVRIAGNHIEGMRYGGLFLIGQGHVVERNRFVRINQARCGAGGPPALCVYRVEEPLMLGAGIYLGRGAERVDPARNNRIADNVVAGPGMSKNCIVRAPGVGEGDNRVQGNRCFE